MEQFPGNSHTTKEGQAKKAKGSVEKKTVQKVVTGEVKTRKKPFGTKVREVFFGGEVKSASRFIAMDVLIPALKNMVVDATSRGIERVIYGDDARRRSPLGTGARGRVSYHTPPSRLTRPSHGSMLPDQPPHYGQKRGNIQDVILVSREEAEGVIEQMADILDTYEMVSIADFHQLVGLPTTYIDNKWGWTSLAYADVQQIREGFLVVLPPVEPLG